MCGVIYLVHWVLGVCHLGRWELWIAEEIWIWLVISLLLECLQRLWQACTTQKPSLFVWKLHQVPFMLHLLFGLSFSLWIRIMIFWIGNFLHFVCFCKMYNHAHFYLSPKKSWTFDAKEYFDWCTACLWNDVEWRVHLFKLFKVLFFYQFILS